MNDQHIKILNYDHVCEHCGRQYRSNRSTSRFCSDQHRALAWHVRRKGVVKVKRKQGEVIPNYRDVLTAIYRDNGGNINNHYWCWYYSGEELRKSKMYHGPLPVGSEIIIIDGFAIMRKFMTDRRGGWTRVYFFKPLSKLSLSELKRVG